MAFDHKMWTMYPNLIVFNIFPIIWRCWMHRNHKITCLPLNILRFVKKYCSLGLIINMAKNMDPLWVQITSAKNLFRTPIYIKFFICTAKRPWSEHGKLKNLRIFFSSSFQVSSKSWTRSRSNVLEPNMILKTTSNGLFERSNIFFTMYFIRKNQKKFQSNVLNNFCEGLNFLITKIWWKKIKTEGYQRS